MKLLSLEVGNFRQFAGKQVIEFATKNDHNITLIFGANGSGKTTILNAFIWCLYGEFTPDVEHTERLFNDQVWSSAEVGETLEAWVTLEFEHEGSTFTARRSVIQKKVKDGPQHVRHGGDLSLTENDPTGRTSARKNPEDSVDRILPKRLHEFFFLNGERIERLSSGSAYQEIEEATKTLLGLEVLERATTHLEKVRHGFEKELKKVGSGEQQQFARDLETARHQKEALKGAVADAESNAKARDDEKRRVDARLRELEGAKNLQKLRDKLEGEREQLVSDIARTRREQDHSLATKGFWAFTDGLSERADSVVGELASKGELPAPFKKPFIDELLEARECICGASLTPGDMPYLKVEAYRNRGGLTEVEQVLMTIQREVEHAQESRSDLFRLLGEQSSKLHELEERLRSNTEESSEVSKQLSDVPSEEIQQLEERRNKLDQDARKLLMEATRIKDRIAAAEKDIRAAEKGLRDAEAKDKEAALVSKRARVSNEAQSAVHDVYLLLKDVVRRKLDTKIKNTFHSISYKDREPELNENFELRLWNSVDGNRMTVAKSTGENMLLSLSFVGGLASLAREQAKREVGDSAADALVAGAGGIYPVVADAAFGNLDESYGAEVARALPNLTEQVVILVSKGQSEGQVIDLLEDRVGKCFSIASFTSKEKSAEEVSFLGAKVPYKLFSKDAREGAEIHELDIEPGKGGKE